MLTIPASGGGAVQLAIDKDPIDRTPTTLGPLLLGASLIGVADSAETAALIRRMHAMAGLSNALRAQEHEFTNWLHVIAGLLDLGEIEEARGHLDLIVEENVISAEDLRSRIGPPVVAALLLAKWRWLRRAASRCGSPRTPAWTLPTSIRTC